MPAALAVGTLALAAPTYAQTGVSGHGAINGGAANPNGSVGTTSNTPRNAMSAQAGPDRQATMGMQGNMQSSMVRQGRRGDAGERQMTECLNTAAAQHQSMDGCRR
jgi:hypothetical protein